MSDITVRHLKFNLGYEEEFTAEVMPGEIEMSYVLIGISMILPYLEPYIIRHSVEAQLKVSTPELLHDMRQFCKQEGQHYRQHALFNERVRAKYPELAAMETKVELDYQRFSERGDRFNLAYTEGFESFTGPFILFMWNSGVMKKVTGPLADMAAWHFLEELEHRTVAYDVYHHFYDSYCYRVCVSLIAQGHLLKFVLGCTRLMLRKERNQFRARGGWYGRLSRIGKWSWLAARYMLPQLLKTYLPGYDPRNLVVPGDIVALAETYDARAHKLDRGMR